MDDYHMEAVFLGRLGVSHPNTSLGQQHTTCTTIRGKTPPPAPVILCIETYLFWSAICAQAQANKRQLFLVDVRAKLRACFRCPHCVFVCWSSIGELFCVVFTARATYLSCCVATYRIVTVLEMECTCGCMYTAARGVAKPPLAFFVV